GDAWDQARARSSRDHEPRQIVRSLSERPYYLRSRSKNTIVPRTGNLHPSFYPPALHGTQSMTIFTRLLCTLLLASVSAVAAASSFYTLSEAISGAFGGTSATS